MVGYAGSLEASECQAQLVLGGRGQRSQNLWLVPSPARVVRQALLG